MSALPTDSEERKNYPLLRGCLNYFPAALAGVARWSKLGNDKHNPGEELHHARGKSMDHGDCILRHMTDLQAFLANYERGAIISANSTVKQSIIDEADALAWRALALSQELHERFAGAELAPAAKPAELGLIGLGKQAGSGELRRYIPPTFAGRDGIARYEAQAEIEHPTLEAYNAGINAIAKEVAEKEAQRVREMRRRLEGEKF
jgi:hypothetical protein